MTMSGKAGECGYGSDTHTIGQLVIIPRHRHRWLVITYHLRLGHQQIRGVGVSSVV